MNQYKVIRKVKLSARHRPTGKTQHFQESEMLSTPAMLSIAKYKDEDGFYLLYFDDQGTELTDTYHSSLQEAMAQADWEFNVKQADWEIVQET